MLNFQEFLEAFGGRGKGQTVDTGNLRGPLKPQGKVAPMHEPTTAPTLVHKPPRAKHEVDPHHQSGEVRTHGVGDPKVIPTAKKPMHNTTSVPHTPAGGQFHKIGHIVSTSYRPEKERSPHVVHPPKGETEPNPENRVHTAGGVKHTGRTMSPHHKPSPGGCPNCGARNVLKLHHTNTPGHEGHSHTCTDCGHGWLKTSKPKETMAHQWKSDKQSSGPYMVHPKKEEVESVKTPFDPMKIRKEGLFGKIKSALSDKPKDVSSRPNLGTHSADMYRKHNDVDAHEVPVFKPTWQSMKSGIKNQDSSPFPKVESTIQDMGKVNREAFGSSVVKESTLNRVLQMVRRKRG